MRQLIVACFVCMALYSNAQKIPFQGRLLENGSPFNGTATIDFSIDTPPWTETISNIDVQDGYYSVILGEITPLPDSLFGDSREIPLNITVNGEALSPVTLHSPLLPFTSGLPIGLDTLASHEVEITGINDDRKIVLVADNDGYDALILLKDSLNQTGAFLTTDRTTGTGGYMQLNGRDFTNGGLRSAVAIGTIVSGRQNSFMDLYGGNSTADGAQLLVDVYASDIDLNGDIPDGYRRGGIDIYNYFGNPTHNIFSEHVGTSTISHLNLNTAQDGAGPQFNVNMNSGDGVTTGGSLSLRNFDGASGVTLDGTNMGTVNVGERVFLFGDFNSTGAGGIDVTDAGGLLRAQVNGPGGRIDVFGPSGSNNVALRGRGDSDFGYVEMFNNNSELRAEIGSFGDNSGFMILYGNNGNKNIQIDRNPSNTDMGQLNIFGSDGITARVFASAETDGSNEWGFFSLDGPTGGVFMDGNSGNISAVGDISGNTLTSSDGTVQTSDRRLKKNILDLVSPLDKAIQLRGVSYQWKDENKSQRTQIGVIAQEVEKIYPEFVHTNDKGMKAVNYAQMTAVLIEAIKELNAKVEKLESENSTLKASLSEVEQLRKEMDQLMKVLGSSKAASK